MRIGLDGLPLHEPKTGVGHYTFELARALAIAAPTDEFELVSPRAFLAGAVEEETSALPPNLRAVRVATNALSRRWWLVGLPAQIKRAGYALFHGTNYEVPLWGRAPTVLTIHDLTLLSHPATHNKTRVRRARRRLPLMARAATLIVTPTASVRREACERLRLPPAKVFVVPEAPRRCFRPVAPADSKAVWQRLGIADEFVLFVGTIEPRKNLSALLAAYEETTRALSGARRAPQLVIAGGKGWLTEEFYARVAASPLRERILLPGYLADEDLAALYSSCCVFVYPSLAEGFGLPPLEAMACGAPVIASRIPALSETLGEGARLVAPADTHALAQSIIELARSEEARRRLAASGLRRAAAFSWERTAQMTREVYAEALERGQESKVRGQRKPRFPT